MGKKIQKLKRIKKIRIHSEGNDTLVYSAVVIVVIAAILWNTFSTHIPFWCFVAVFGTIWCIVLNFFRCPIRYFNGATGNLVVAPADGRIVVIEEVDEDEYFHDKRLMVSIFMSLWNVHAN